jgi:hypothetical protein
MKVLRMASSGQVSRQRWMRSRVLSTAPGRAWLQDLRAGVLEGNVQVRQQLAFGHQRDDVVDVRVRIDVVQAGPDAQLGQALAQRLHARLVRLAAPFALGVLQIDAVGRGVLRDHQQLRTPPRASFSASRSTRRWAG